MRNMVNIVIHIIIYDSYVKSSLSFSFWSMRIWSLRLFIRSCVVRMILIRKRKRFMNRLCVRRTRSFGSEEIW